MFLSQILMFLSGFFRLAITNVKTTPNLQANIEQAGALVPGAALIPALSALAQNAAPAFGNWSSTIVPNISAATYQGTQMVQGIISRFTPAANFTDCTDTATNIVNAIPGAVVNQTFPMIVANLGSGIETLAAGTGVTISGTATIASNATRLFLGKVTGSTAVTITSLFQWGNGTGFTNVTGL